MPPEPEQTRPGRAVAETYAPHAPHAPRSARPAPHAPHAPRSARPALFASQRPPNLGVGRPGAAAADCPEVPGLITTAEADLTAQSIAGCQLSSGMIPWFDGGHADPWNHTEAAMALTVAGRRAEAEAAYQWLADAQRADGSWHQYYTASGVEQDKLDANVIAYSATGVWHHWLRYGDTGFLAEMWPVASAALDFVLRLQTPGGEILWARHADGTPWPFALLTGSSSISHSLRCGLAIARQLGEDRPGWELSLARLTHAIRLRRPEAFSPKDRWAMDWYYPVLTGVLRGAEARAALAARRDEFVLDGEGVRCVSDKDWVTAAETCECAMAFLAAGDRRTAESLFAWAQRLRTPDGRYHTGRVLPHQVTFPDGERTTYSAAAVLLAADALAGASSTSRLFADHGFLPAPLSMQPRAVDDRVF